MCVGVWMCVCVWGCVCVCVCVCVCGGTAPHAQSIQWPAPALTAWNRPAVTGLVAKLRRVWFALVDVATNGRVASRRWLCDGAVRPGLGGFALVVIQLAA